MTPIDEELMLRERVFCALDAMQENGYDPLDMEIQELAIDMLDRDSDVAMYGKGDVDKVIEVINDWCIRQEEEQASQKIFFWFLLITVLIISYVMGVDYVS